MDKDKDKIEYMKYITKLVIIRNCISVICCTILAIVFHKWWLIFIAILFTTFLTTTIEESK